ncbi:MAG: hypothetical protein QM725_02310 [Lacibacter sp.]
MSDNLLDILKDDDDISEQELQNYLEGKLSPEERHELEKRLASSEMMSDAEEGLSQVKNKEDVPVVVAEINRRLTMQLHKRRHKKLKGIPSQTLTITAAFIILLLIALAYFIIYRLKTG